MVACSPGFRELWQLLKTLKKLDGVSYPAFLVLMETRTFTVMAKV
ncbi:hypothetical protein [Leptothoe spongobia]|nr:hypothetical protein [Leptothoe spongobia]